MAETEIETKITRKKRKKFTWEEFLKLYLVLAVLFLIMFTMRATVTILQVFVPKISSDFSMNSGELAVIFTIYNMTAALVSLLVGPLAEKFGYKIVILFGMIIFTSGIVLSSFSINFTMIAVAQFIAGIGAALFGPTTIAFAGDYFPKDKISSFVGIIMSSFYVGTIIAVPINSYIGDILKWQWGIGIMGIIGGLVIVLIIFILPRYRKSRSEDEQEIQIKMEETPLRTNTPRSYIQGFIDVFKSKYAIGVFFITLFQRGGLFAMTTILSDWVLTVFGKDTTYSGLILMGSGITALISNTLFSWFADHKIGKRGIILLGTALTGIWIGVFPVISVNIGLAIFGFLLLNFFGGIAMGSYNAFITEVIPDSKGTVVSINNTFGQFSQAIAVAIIVRVIYNKTNNYSYAGFAAMGFFVVAIILMLIFVRPAKIKEDLLKEKSNGSVQ